MIVSEAQRLQKEGKTGLEILPGVHDLLTTVSLECVRRVHGEQVADQALLPVTILYHGVPYLHEPVLTLLELNSAPTPVWAIVTSATHKYASHALPTAGKLFQ